MSEPEPDDDDNFPPIPLVQESDFDSDEEGEDESVEPEFPEEMTEEHRANFYKPSSQRKTNAPILRKSLYWGLLLTQPAPGRRRSWQQSGGPSELEELRHLIRFHVTR